MFGILLLCGFDVSAMATKLEIAEMKFSNNRSSINNKYWFAKPKQKNNSVLPLIIYLHGRGGVGESPDKIKKQVNHIVQYAQKFSEQAFYFAAPQTSKSYVQGGGWQVAELNLFLNHLKQSYNIDPKRVYLTGNSMGGMGTWIWAATHPEQFAAIAPISGGLKKEMKKYVPKDTNIVEGLVKMPVWALAGGKDKVVPATLSEKLIEAIVSLGNSNAQFTLYPDAKHNVRTQIFANSEIYSWLFNHKQH